MVSQSLLMELKEILKADYDFEPNQTELSESGNTLIDYFEALLKAKRNKYEGENLRNRNS